MDVKRGAPGSAGKVTNQTPTEPEARRGAIRDRLRDLTVRQQRFERYLGRQLHVDPAGLAVMDHLVNVGPTTPTDLARLLGSSTAAMTLVIDRLVAGGHAYRQPHPTDRRKVIVEPAEGWGATAYQHVAPIILGVADAAEALTPKEQATVAAFLERIVGVYDDATHA